MAKGKPESESPKPLSPSLDKILDEDRIGLAQEQRMKLRLMRVYVSIKFDQSGRVKRTGNV